MSTGVYKDAIQAAGHDGAMESADGELFLKPTCQEEMEFYNAIADNEVLLDITCKFMGTLTEQTLKEEFSVTAGDDTTHTPSDSVNIKSLSINAADDAGDDDIPGSHTIIHPKTIESIVQEAEISQDLTKIHNYLTSTKSFTLVLENATSGFTQPCILDAKLGAQLWDEAASLDKRERLDQVSKSTISGSLGVRVAGMSLYNPRTKERIWYDKQFGRKMIKEQVIEGFSELFFDQEYFLSSKEGVSTSPPIIEVEKKRVLSHHIKEELEYMYEVLSKYELRMISASVLIIYEGDEEAFEEKLARGNAIADEGDEKEDHGDDSDDSEDLQQQPPLLFRVKLIDFAHSKMTPGLGPDENSLQGLRSLIDIFMQLEKRYESLD